MKIAIIGSRGFPGIPAGVEKSLEEVCPRLAARGHDVTLYCSDKVATPDAVYRGVKLRRTPAIHTKHLETVSRVIVSGAHAAFSNYDIAHFHSIGPSLFSWMTRATAKTVVTVHGLDWQRAKWGALARRTLQLGEQSAVWFPHRTVVVSQALQRHYKESYDRDVTFIPNGVTIKPARAARQIREKWGLEPGSYAFFASRLVEEKGCHTLIEAFAKTRTDKKLVIAGASWHSDDYVAGLKKQAANDPRVVFAGWAEGELLEELFSNAYLYVLPSEIEGLSLSLLEGMGYGICPLTSDIQENTDVTRSAGVSFRTNDAADLAEKLQALFDDPARTRAIGEAAKALVAEEYSWDKAAEQLERVYAELLAKGRGGSAPAPNRESVYA